VIKFIKLFILILFITNCSLDKKSGLWNKQDRVKIEEKLVSKSLFKEDKKHNKEFNTNVRVQLKSKLAKNNLEKSLVNNIGRLDFDGNLKKIAKFNFKKIDNFNKVEPEIAFEKKNIIFFDNKGSIIKFSENSKVIWKKNFYTRSEKKLKPVLNILSYKNYLIVTDNLAKYYLLDIKTGDLLWMKNNIAPFNSQIKVYKDKFFATDFENVLRCFLIKSGEEIWKFKTDTSFIKSQKKLSLVVSDEKIYFNNSIGDISAVDIESGKPIWQTPTQDSSIYESSFYLKTSELIFNNKRILFSNNKNEFYSIDSKTGTLYWKQKANSSVRPTITDNLVFTVTEEGMLIIIEEESGNIVRITDVFDIFKHRKRKNIKPVGFVVGTNNIYLTTDNGKLITIDIITGKSKSILKIDNDIISKPFIFNNNLFIVKDNAIIKLD